MERNIKVGEREIKFKATAATPIHYRNQFKKDLIKEFAKAEGEPDASTFCELAYIMSGEFKNGTSLEDWLEEFEPMELLEKADEIIDVYIGNTIGTEEKGKNE